MNEIKGSVEELAKCVTAYKLGTEKELSALKQQIENVETHLGRGNMGGGMHSSSSKDPEKCAEHSREFLAWARKGGNEAALQSLEIQAGLSTLSDPDGGFLVPEEMDKDIERLALDSVAMRRLARIKQTKGEYKKPLSTGGAGGGWVAEKGDRDETTTPELKLFQPFMAEMYACPEATQKLLDMSDFDVAAWLTEEINDTFTALEGAAFISGNGVGKPKGIIDTALMIADASWSYGKTGYIAGGHATLLNNADKLIDLQHALKAVYRKNAFWLMNDTTFAVIRKLKDGDGNYLWRPGVTEGAPDMLLGKPVEIDDNMPDIGAGAFPVAIADFKRAYTIVDHTSGLRLLRDPFTKKGFVKFYTTKRVTGGISNYQAIKFLKITAS